MLPVRATDINQFMNRRQPNWTRLEALLQQVEARGLESLTPAEVREFGILYRRTSSDLVTARAKTANAGFPTEARAAEASSAFCTERPRMPSARRKLSIALLPPARASSAM